ncbi:hypothetical protein SprV_0501975000 [Sparganum proliferum]
MLLGGGAGYQEVVNTGVHKRLAAKHLVYEILEGLADVAESKGYAQKLHEFKGSDDGCLRNLPVGDTDLTEDMDQIDLRENGLAKKTSDEAL